jgi:mannose/cellobiose epimerase-like protein (N-acyl-D-glucosamine 2-epimerase family)
MGCSNHSRIDAAWHTGDMVGGVLSHWLTVAPTASGFMREAVDRQWQPKAEQPGYLTEHARLVYSLAIGFEQTKDQRYLDAATRGADFMLARYRDPVNGGFFLRVAQDGTVISGAKNTYAHAFALLALSHMARVTGDARYRDAALDAWRDIDTGLRNPLGGFHGELPRNFSQVGADANTASSQNPLMHLFEALLALHDATHDPAALKGAKSIADFVIYRLLVGTSDGGAYIPEWYDRDWKPLATREKGGYVDLGHQFEWSHMLMAAAQLGLSDIYLQIAQRLLKFGVEKGYDEAEGGIYTKMYPDGTVEKDKYWWQQCEGLRAFMASASTTGRKDMWRRYEQTVDLVRAQFIDPVNGGWFSRSRKQCGGCPDDQPDPYHMTGMHHAALALADKGQ